jgi:alpha-beta hydrolase superfamily lysophospholipase
MRTLGEAVAEAGWQAEAVLLPGLGPDIPNLGRYGRKDWLGALAIAWSRITQGARPWVLCGYSMGGTLALLQALEQPPDTLVLVSPFTRLPGLLPRLLSAARFFIKQIQPFRNANFSDPRVREQFAAFLPGVDLSDPEVQQTIREEFVLPLEPLHEILELGKAGYRRAPEISSPTLIIQGVDDPLVRPHLTRRLTGRMDPALTSYHEIPGAHDLMAANGNSNAEAIALILDHLKVFQ